MQYTRLFGSQQDTVDLAFTELQLKTAAHDEGWGLGQSSWAVDLQAGTITFTNEKFRATAPVQVIGTYDTTDGSFLWGWDHPSVLPHCAEHAQKVRVWAEQHSVDALLERKIHCTEEDAWRLTALAAHFAGAQGAYRGPAGQALVFMTFGEVSLSRP